MSCLEEAAGGEGQLLGFPLENTGAKEGFVPVCFQGREVHPAPFPDALHCSSVQECVYQGTKEVKQVVSPVSTWCNPAPKLENTKKMKNEKLQAEQALALKADNSEAGVIKNCWQSRHLL